MNISQLNINSKIVKALLKCGYEQLTPVQSATLDPILEGKDLLVRSQTGSGKTMAFAIPLVNNLTSGKGVEVLVVSPTRELAQQVAQQTRKLTRGIGDELVNTIYGGASIEKQIKTLKSGRTKIVVGTPGRILDHIKRGTLDLSTIKSVVLDEADEMLNMGFLPDIESILSHTSSNRQTLLFSATYPPVIAKLAHKYLNNATNIEIGIDNASISNLVQEHIHVARNLKFSALVKVLQDRTPSLTIVFCNTKSMTETLAKQLRDNGYRASALNGDMAQSVRNRMMRNIREGRSNILVATDVAARGIDIDNVAYVINYDIPSNSQFYLHRIGRTARAGKQGNSVSITTTKEQIRAINTIAKETKSTIGKYNMDNLEAVSLIVSDSKEQDIVVANIKSNKTTSSKNNNRSTAKNAKTDAAKADVNKIDKDNSSVAKHKSKTTPRKGKAINSAKSTTANTDTQRKADIAKDNFAPSQYMSLMAEGQEKSAMARYSNNSNIDIDAPRVKRRKKTDVKASKKGTKQYNHYS